MNNLKSLLLYIIGLDHEILKHSFSYLILFCWTLFTLIPTNGYSQEFLKLTNSSEFLFQENKGQLTDEIKFSLETLGSNLYLRTHGFSYHLYDYGSFAEQLKTQHDGTTAVPKDIQNHLIHQTFLNSKVPVISKRKPSPTIFNYLYGEDEKNWGQHVKSYSEIYCDEVYKGIDLRYFTKNKKVKYELLVEPWANPNQIQMSYQGATAIEVNDRGQLVIITSLDTIIEETPYLYQMIDGQVTEVFGSYKIRGNTVRFKIGTYNKNYQLVIDPSLIFSTYSGSNADNWGNTACYDDDGNLYAGSTVFRSRFFSSINFSERFITTSGAFQTLFNGGDADMGILKFSSNGSQLLYGTYLGGRGTDIPLSMIVDSRQNLYLLSVTSSNNMPRFNNSFDPNFHSGTPVINTSDNQNDLFYNFPEGTDIYLTKINLIGFPTASTYFGGARNEGLAILDPLFSRNYKNLLRGDIAIDSNSDIIISSYTESNNLGSNSFKTSIASDTASDGIIAKFDSELSELKWSAYVGGGQDDALFGLTIDSDNDIYSCGTTLSSEDFTPDNLTDLHATGFSSLDAFIVKIKADGSSMESFVRVGEPGIDESHFVELDSEENVFITGQTENPNFPVTDSVFSNPFGGNFIQSYTSDLSTLRFSTKIGTSNGFRRGPNLMPTAFLVDDCDRIYLSGWGGSSNLGSIRGAGIQGFPVTNDAFKSTTVDGNDFYLSVLSQNAKELLYGTYFGGDLVSEHLDGGMSRFDPGGVVYQSVCTGCEITCNRGNCNIPLNSNFPIFSETSGAFPRQKGRGACNNAVFKFDLGAANIDIDLNAECFDDTVYFKNNSTGAVNFTWDFGDGSALLTTATASDVTHKYVETGRYQVIISADQVFECKDRSVDTLEVTITTSLSTQTFTDTVCSAGTYNRLFYPDSLNFDYRWTSNSSSTIDHPNTANPTLWITDQTDFLIVITDDLGCSRTDTFEVDFPDIQLDFIPNDRQSCQIEVSGTSEFQNLSTDNLRDQDPMYRWTFSDGSNFEGIVPPKINHTTYDTITVTLIAELLGCQTDTSTQLIFPEIRYPNIFTPNQDGKNDTYVINGLNQNGWSFKVSNRWGKEVYQSENYQNDFEANGLGSGTYFYLIKSPDGTNCKGWVQILR